MKKKQNYLFSATFITAAAGLLSVLAALLPYGLSAQEENEFFQSVEAAEAVAKSAVKYRVNDYTGLLSPETVSKLESSLDNLEKTKGSQVVVVIVPTTKPLSISEYSLLVAESAKPGRKNIDDGVVFLIALQDRKMRIETGYGLEGAIPDAYAKKIISDIVAPDFKKGNYESGVIAGTEAIIRLIEGEPLPSPESTEDDGSAGGFITILVLFILILFFIILPALRAMGLSGNSYRSYNSGYWGGGFGGSSGGSGGSFGDFGGFGGGGGGFGGGGASGDW
jgi:uncharacterized protein